MPAKTAPAVAKTATKATKAPAATKARKAATTSAKAPTKAATKAKAPARPIPTPDAPLASGWVRQSLAAPEADRGASRWTTQTQRRLLRAIVSGEATEFGGAPAPTLRSVDRLASLGYVVLAKNGSAKATKAGTEFVAANPAPRIREAAPKAAAKVPAKAAPKAKAKAAPKAAPKAPRKAKGETRVVRLTGGPSFDRKAKTTTKAGA